MRDLMWAQSYALANREQMMDAVMIELVDAIGYEDTYSENSEKRRINCHHNYTAREHHFGQNVWITRKGAISAKVNEYGVIPGSMGTNTFIVKGLGNKASYNSSAHGAGRKMSRTQAKKELSVESLEAAMEGKTWLVKKSQALLDEHPDSYKDIHQIMRDQADLVEVEVELHQILNYKGA
jgi:tRNA-splicing ligase RtcB